VRPHAVTSGQLGRGHDRALQHATELFHSLEEGLSCHEVVEAMQFSMGRMGCHPMRGRCREVEHSWFAFEDGAVLDPYRPGFVPPVVLVAPTIASLDYREADHAVGGP
jgi:hypothetical protein